MVKVDNIFIGLNLLKIRQKFLAIFLFWFIAYIVGNPLLRKQCVEHLEHWLKGRGRQYLLTKGVCQKQEDASRNGRGVAVQNRILVN